MQKKPSSTIEKWLFHDRNFSRGWLAEFWGISPQDLREGMRTPWRFMTLDKMVDVSRLCEIELFDVVAGCMRPSKHTRNYDELDMWIVMQKLNLKHNRGD